MPTYVTKKDFKTERLVVDIFYKMGWLASLTDLSCRWDIEAMTASRTAFIEVKRRHIKWGAYPTIFIDKSKVDAIEKRANQAKNGVGMFVVVADDLIPRYVTLHQSKNWKTNTIDVRPERHDASDRGDVKYEIPIGEFRLLSDL